MKLKRGHSPLYLQLRNEIRRKIETGEYPPGTAIPSEKQLAEHYGVHRLSVRIALDALLREGLLKSSQGKGVYVCGPKTRRSPQTVLSGFRHGLEEHEKDAETRLLVKAERSAGPYYAKLLQINPEDSIWYIRRIDSISGQAVALEDIYITASKLPELPDIDLQMFSLYDAFYWSGIHVSQGKQTLCITRLDAATARLLGLKAKQPVMQESYLIQDEAGEPVAFSRCYIRAEKAEYTIQCAIRNA